MSGSAPESQIPHGSAAVVGGQRKNHAHPTAPSRYGPDSSVQKAGTKMDTQRLRMGRDRSRFGGSFLCRRCGDCASRLSRCLRFGPWCELQPMTP